MKKRMFSLKLYLEGIKQTKIIGIMSFIILALQAIAIPVGQAIDNWSNNYVGVSKGIEFAEINPFLFAVTYIVAPLLALSLFSFLNKRQSSDFYHSIADTRICLFLSYFAAICTWIVTLCISSTLIAIISHNIFPQYFTLNYVNIWLTMFNIIASSLYCAAAVTLAMTLTGTLITNIAVTGLILILPDYLLFMLDNMVVSEVPIIRTSMGFGDVLPVGFNFLSSSMDYTSVGDAIYTIILAIVLSAIALIIFKFRKSESAGYPALNKYLQAGIRIIFCMVVCIFACGGIFNISTNNDTVLGDDIFILVLIYLCALIVYFLYELITTKKLRSIPKTIPALLIVVVLNIVCVMGMIGMYNSYLAFEPAASEIDYIKVDQSEDYIYDISDYLEKKCSSIKLKDEQTKEIVSAVLSDNIKKVRKDTFYENFKTAISVKICANGIEHSRYLTLSEEDLNTILEALKNSDDFMNTYSTLPEASAVSVDTYNIGTEISSKDAMRIYNLLRKEVASTDFEEWYVISNGYEAPSLCDFRITVIDGTETYDIYIPLYTVFEETATELIKTSYDKKQSDEILKLLETPGEIDSINVSFFNANDVNDIYYYADDESYNMYSDNINKLVDCLEPVNEVKADDIYVRVNIYNDYEDRYEDYVSFYKFTGDINDFK